MTERKYGYYWVKYDDEHDWEVELWGGSSWFGHMLDHDFSIVGPRIPAPGEGWQCVPTTPTYSMVSRSGGITIPRYRAMLAVAPSPDDHDA